ncbi:major facilitator superfamily domain-containing protein [Ditylenchus destructor]|nr:major facilitator superfamily domain-containing protein [Ditylenchus destructor]
MCSTFIKFPVFQSLLYEKACLEKYYMDFERCSNVSAVHADVDLQQQANHLLMISTLFLMVPSIFASLLLGSLCDVWSIKSTMLIPFVGLLFADVNYIVQCLFMGSNAYFLILSDIVFGLTGGFNAIIGILFAYSVKANKTSVRSERVALLEGVIGLGSTIGSIFSGFIRQKIGYTWIFVIITVMHVFAIMYVVFFVKDLNATDSEQSSEEEQAYLIAAPVGLRQSISRRIREIGNVYCGRERDPKTQRFLNLVLIALAIELIGLMDILFSYLRYQFKWTDKEYGWFSGTGSALGSLTVIFVYPFLHKGIGLSNAILAIIGLVSKISNLVILVLASSNWVAALSILPLAFSRFISTGLRSMASFYVKNHEQG